MAYNYKTKPYEHQRQALIKGAEKNDFAYFMEMGTGKTKVAIDNASYLYTQDKVKGVLVIAPNSVYRNWANEIDIHCPVEHDVKIHKKNKIFDWNDSKLNFYLMNVEAFSTAKAYKVIEKIIIEHYKEMMVIVDESTTIKNRSAKRTKNLTTICRIINYKRILTGSPVTKSPLDLFSQCEFLNPNLLGFSNFYVFRARYCVMRNITVGGSRQVPLPMYYTNLDDLEMKLKNFSYRVRKEECLDLPEKVYVKRYVQLKGEQLEVYSDLKKYARAIFENEEASYANKLTEILKLHQVCCGYFVSDEGLKKDIDNPKLDELLNTIEENEGKIIIWANYIHSLEKIISKLETKYGKESTVAIYGAVSVDQRQEAVKRFQEDKNTRFFVGNPVTGGYGLNLTKAHTVIYFSNSYDLEVRQQSEDRAHRIGQTSKVTYIDIIAQGTIDEFIIKALNNKIKISAQTLGEDVLTFL